MNDTVLIMSKTYEKITYFDFDLNRKPSERWDTIFDHFNLKLGDIKKKLIGIINHYGAINPFAGTIYNAMDHKNIMFHDEILFIADRLKMAPYQILALQLIYEFSSACTTGIFKIGSEEYFIRTMDWSLDILRDITVGLRLVKGKKEIGKVIGWIGCVGFFTGIMPDYEIAINYRRTTEMNIPQLIVNILRTYGLKWPVSYLIRYMMENELQLENVVKLCTEAQLVSPTYFTIRVINKDLNIPSQILTRDADQIHNIRYLNVDGPYLVQTNCDHDKSYPDILWSLERRELFDLILNELNELYNQTGKCSKKIVFKSFCKAPIINSETVYFYLSSNDKSIAFKT